MSAHPFAMAVLVLGCAAAQDLVPKAAPIAGPVVIQGAVLHTMDRGTIVGGTLWFHDGVIRGVHAAGEAPPLPAGSKPLVVDGRKLHVFPGLVAAVTQLGLQEIGMVRQRVDVDELGELSPEVVAAVAVNPDSAALPVARSNGVLVAGVFPSGGAIPGRASVIQLDGWTNADLTVLAEAGIVVDWPALPEGGPRRRGPRAEAAGQDTEEATRKARQRIDEAVAAAAGWVAARRADPATPPDLRAEAWIQALRREVPVFLLADELEEIESAVTWAARRQLRAVVVGGRDAAACVDLLREHAVPVVVTGTHKLPRRDDSPYDEPFTLPARLHALGIPFCIATGDSFSNERNLPYHAATAAAFGLDRQQALAAITRDAAAILGVGDRLGTLAPGKEATLLLADGDPLELTTRIERAFVRGREIDLSNKQTALAGKYRAKYRQLGEDR
jgi:imidazolonepropionase-like amidohydrolase